jgi:hypothetical protein
MRESLTRRRLLGALLVAPLWFPLSRTLQRSEHSDRLVNSYASLDAKIGLKVVDLGEAYLCYNPAELSHRRLAELIVGLHGASLWPALTRGEPAMQVALGEVYRSDFDLGRVVCLEGWVVSLTEARLHAWRRLTAI